MNMEYPENVVGDGSLGSEPVNPPKLLGFRK